MTSTDMKKFITPEVKVIGMESNIVCASLQVGGAGTTVGGHFGGEADAPVRRSPIFDDSSED